MNSDLKDDLVKQYGSISTFAQEATDGDFIWGIADLFGYENPADFAKLDTSRKTLVALSFFCKEFLQGGLASVFENLPEFLPTIDAGLRQYGAGCLPEEFQQILARAKDERVDLADDDARWDFIERADDFRLASVNCESSFADLLVNLRDAVKSCS